MTNERPFGRIDVLSNQAFAPCLTEGCTEQLPTTESSSPTVFSSQDNLLHGRFLAELTKEVFGDLESQKYTLTEYRISVYGRKREEWDGLAAWIFNNRLHSEQNVWLIQIPRLFQIYKAQGTMNNFQEMLDNIFIPLFEVRPVRSSAHRRIPLPVLVAAGLRIAQALITPSSCLEVWLCLDHLSGRWQAALARGPLRGVD